MLGAPPAELFGRQEKSLWRQRHAARCCSLFVTLLKCSEELVVRFSKAFGLFQDEYARIGILEDRRFEWVRQRKQKLSAREELTVIGKGELFG